MHEEGRLSLGFVCPPWSIRLEPETSGLIRATPSTDLDVPFLATLA